MRILGHGIDLVSVPRFREVLERQGDAFLNRCFTEAERAYCTKHADPAPFFAARFAAKEAFAKACAWGLAKSNALTSLSVVHEESGRPVLQFLPDLQGRLQEIGCTGHFLSLSHEGEMALASVILVGD